MTPLGTPLRHHARRALATAILCLFAFMLPQTAASQSWQSGYGQGTAVARVASSNGANIAVYCPEGQVQSAPSIWFTPSRIANTSGAVVVGYVIDGQTYAFNANWNATGAAEVVVGTHANRRQFNELMSVLQSGSTVTAIAGNVIAEQTFPLRGSSAAIGYAMGFCPG